MANVTETARWDTGVYQIEKSDKVLGGADGKVNLQAQQLANRTVYLKQQVEAKANKTDLTTGLNGKANSSHTHTMDNITGLSAAMNAKANLASPTFTGAPKAPTPAQTVNDTTLATTAFVKSAIAALVGAAPATLDTLAEIATALGSDANLKQTLLNEIANVKKEAAERVPYAYGKRYAKIDVNNDAFAGFTVFRTGANGSWESSINARVDKRWSFEVSGSHTVFLPAKQGTTVLDTDFSHVLARTGWTKLPNGLILQWGEATPRNGTALETFRFNIAFNQCFQVFLSDNAYQDDAYTFFASLRSVTNSGFTVLQQNLGAFAWFAIGM